MAKPSGQMAYNCELKRFVKVIAHDGNKYVAYLNDGVREFSKAYNFSNRVFEEQERRDVAFASRVLRNKRKAIPFDPNFWRNV